MQVVDVTTGMFAGTDEPTFAGSEEAKIYLIFMGRVHLVA